VEIPDIILQSDHWLAVNKPSGMVVHRSRGANDYHTLVRVMRDHLGPNVFPVNRLDRQTSGIILMARCSDSARELSTAFAERRVSKTYQAVVRGWPPLEAGDEHLIDRELGGKAAESRVYLLEKSLLDLQLGKHPQTRLAKLEIHPKTGIHHQIRRHLRGWGYPIINDHKHGDRPLNRAFHDRFKLKRMLLHSYSLSFPFGGETFTATADWSGRNRGLLHHLGLMPGSEVSL
jgi:tRNA pseudouridine65 synthase